MLAAVLALGLLGSGCAAADPGPALTVRDGDGALLTRVPLPAPEFAVSYRNSVYGTLAEERYTAREGGRFRLVELAADQLAVLEEYYAVPGPVRTAPSGDRRRWVAEPRDHPEFGELSIAATALGERTVHVPGQAPIPLPPLVTDGVTVVLDVEES